MPYEEEFFRTSSYDVVLLQEVRHSSFERIRHHFDWGFLSLDEQDRRRIGVAILGRAPLTAHSPESVGTEVFEHNGHVPTPLARWFEARNLSVLLDLPGSSRPVRLMTAHATPGTSRGPKSFDEPKVGRFKPVFHSTLSRVIESWDTEFIFSLDANSPKVDSLDWSKVEFYREADAASGFREAHLLGSDSERVAATKVETCGDIGSRQMAARTCRTNRLPAPSPSHTELETVGDFATTTFTARQVSRCVRWDIDSMMTSRTTPSWKRYLRFQLRVG